MPETEIDGTQYTCGSSNPSFWNTAVRAHLHAPDGASDRMLREALNGAMTQRVNFRARSWARSWASSLPPDRHVHIACFIEQQARCTADAGICSEDVLHILQRRSVPGAAHH